MSIVHVERITEAAANARRAEILTSVGDENTFRDRARQYALDDAEQELFDELEDLEFLLGL